MKKTHWLTIAFILLTNLVWAQKLDKSSTSLSFSVELKQDSKAEEITFNIEAGAQVLELKIFTTVWAGKVNIEVLDPADTKQGTFSVGTDSQKTGRAMGNLQKSLKEPLIGTWKVKITPTDARGSVEIQTVSLSSK